jgi:predicted nucleic acid-binding protein
VADVQTGVLYLDTLALVKLVIREAETDVLEEELRRWSDLATSVVTSIELSRAVARARTDSAAVVADEYTILGVLAAVAEVPLNDEVRAAASSLSPV